MDNIRTVSKSQPPSDKEKVQGEVCHPPALEESSDTRRLRSFIASLYSPLSCQQQRVRESQ